MDLKVGIALYLVRKASKCQGENKCGCLNMFVCEKQLPSSSCLWPMCLELGSLCVRLCIISGPLPGPGRELGGK